MTERRTEALPVRYAGLEDIVNRVPVSVVWEITLACDLACQHCGSRAGRRRRDELSTSEALDLVDQIAELGARDVGLIGGEAYLRKDWLEIVAAIRAAGMRCDLQTGGRNLSEERVAHAAAAGLCGVGISMDGIGATHDEIRGVPGSFELALAALRRVRAYGLSSAVNTTINAFSLPQLPELMDIIIDAGASNWQLAIMTAMGNAADHPELLLQPWQMLEVMPLLAELALEGRKRGLFLQPASNVGYYGPYESTIRNVVDDEIYFHGCNAGDTVMGIEADGTIKSCPGGLPSPYAGGNIRQMRLRDIWENADSLALVRRRTIDDLWGFCRSCYYAETCMAGCTWTAHALMGRAGNNPMCYHRAREMDRRGLRERLVKVKDAGVASSRSSSRLPSRTLWIASQSMTEPGRVPPLLRLCRGCREFVRPNHADCPFCGGDLNMLQADHEKRVADMRHAAAELREALARVRLTGRED